MKNFVKYMVELAQVIGVALLVITAVLMWVSIMKTWGLL